MSDCTTKTCNRCGQAFPATTEYFTTAKREPNGITQPCRKCRHIEDAEYYSRPDIREKERQRKSTPEYKAKEKAYKRSPECRARERERDKKRRQTPKYQDYSKEYNSRPEVKQRKRELNSLPEKREYGRNYQRTRRLDPEYKEKEREYHKQPAVREMYRQHTQIRRSKARQLPTTLTTEDKHRALEYFNGCCPVCGRQLNDLFNNHTVAWDHWWIAVSKGGGFTRDNIIPLCHGLEGCNNSKSNRDPIEWLTTRYGKRKAQKILKRIQAYFDWLKTAE